MRKTSTVLSIVTLVAALAAFGLLRPQDNGAAQTIAARSKPDPIKAEIDYTPVGTTRQVEHLKRVKAK